MKLKLKILDKIFQPPSDRFIRAGFFTTIPIVPIAIGIGMKVETKEGEGLPAGLSVRNAVKAEASAQAGSEFIVGVSA